MCFLGSIAWWLFLHTFLSFLVFSWNNIFLLWKLCSVLVFNRNNFFLCAFWGALFGDLFCIHFWVFLFLAEITFFSLWKLCGFLVFSCEFASFLVSSGNTCFLIDSGKLLIVWFYFCVFIIICWSFFSVKLFPFVFWPSILISIWFLYGFT